VGLLAIRRIPKGTYIFPGDDEHLVWIQTGKLKGLRRELKKLYEDFCIKKRGLYGCPSNFNRMTEAWYLNHSAKPNVASDKSYRFYAVRDIRKNEELTVDYRTYSELQGRHLTG
jgi:SET domain-containing protein